MTEPAESPLLEVRGLTRRFPGVLALDDASCAFRRGEVVGLVGKNGAGKSTLIKVLAGVVAADAGEVLIDGRPAAIHSTHDATAAGLAFVHQELSDVPNLSVAENVLLGLGFPRRGPFVAWRRLRTTAAAVLARLEATIDPGAMVGELSLVDQRLVMIARALAQQARLVVLDEPTASLSSEEAGHLHAVVRSLARSGVGVVLVTHRLDEVLSLTERVVIMRDGHVVGERATAELTRPALVEAITGSDRSRQPERRLAGAPPPAEGEPVLRVRRLSVPGAIHDVSFDVRPGEVVGLAGLVGSGRSEIARTLVGAQPGGRAEVRVDGELRAMSSPAAAARAGVVLLPEDRRAEGNLLDFSLRENVTLATLPRHRRVPALPMPSPARERRTAARHMRELQIAAAGPEVPVRWLSGGNQQKVLLAKWLDTSARVFIFDEPTQGIDVEGKEEVFGAVARLAGEGRGVLFISSEFSELLRVCHRLLALAEGRIVADLDAAALTELELLHACYGEVQRTRPVEGRQEESAG